MESIPTAYTQVGPDTLRMVRKDINMDKPGEMKEAVRILDEWVKQQSHFLETNFDHHYLEMSIVVSKGSIERAKRIIENMCADRTLRPEYFEPRNPREHYEVFKNNLSVIATPILTPENYRVVILKLFGKCNNDKLTPLYKYAYNCLEYLKVNDYHSGIIFIIDDTELDVPYFVTHVNFMEIKNCFVTCLESYGMRLKRLHLITPSKAVHVILSFFKQFFSKKILDRVVINKTVEELLQYYPKEVLPRDFGGTEKSILDLQETVTKTISTEDYLAYLRKMGEAKIDQSLIPLNQNYDPDNINGTFRSLNID